MDDLFQYLIWGIIIFSFLSSFFKKKEPPKQTPLPKKSTPTDKVELSDQIRAKDVTETSIKHESYDILKELEKVFSGDFRASEEEKPQHTIYYDPYKDSEIENKNLSKSVDPRFQKEVGDFNPIGHRQTYGKIRIDEDKRVSALSKKKIFDTTSGMKELDHNLGLAEHKGTSRFKKDFGKKLKNPVTLKEYILLSEILGKPKALRR